MTEDNGQRFTVANEFADVEVSLDDAGNGPRLQLRDLRTGASIYVDPLQLESLVWAAPRTLEELVDPGMRWCAESPDGLPTPARTNGRARPDE